MKRAVHLTIDSGAYSAFRQREPIDNDEYVQWLCDHSELYDTAINLDVIPGKPGVAPTLSDVGLAAKQGYFNWTDARAAGLQPMPVYHMGESRSWLDKMLAAGATYIGLGGVANAGDKARKPWLDETFAYLCGSKGYPAVKVHGFGITSTKMMSRYPWASVDSVTWMKQGVMGSIYVPKAGHRGDPYDYTEVPYAISVSPSGRKGPSKMAMGNDTHIDSVGINIQSYILKYIHHEGMNLETLKVSYKERIRLNARFFKNYVRQRQAKPFHTVRKGLLGGSLDRGYGSATPPAFRLIYSVGTYLEYSNLLKEEKICDLLISYHRIKYGPDFDLEAFVREGWFIRKSRRNGKVII